VVYQNQHLPVESEFQCIINPVDAELLATANGSGIFYKHRFGKGTVYLFDAPLEISLINSAMRIPDSTQYPYYKIYEEIGHTAIAARLIQRDDPMISTSEHYFSDNEAVVILVNNQPKAASSKFTMNAAWTLDACLYGVMPQAVLTIPANDAIILRLRKNDRQRTSKAGTAI
jgi:hypothetical protein